MDRVEQHLGIADPVKRRNQHQRDADDERDDAPGDESTVVVQGHPADHHVVARQSQSASATPHLVQDGSMRKGHPFLQSRAPAAVLQDGDVVRHHLVRGQGSLGRVPASDFVRGEDLAPNAGQQRRQIRLELRERDHGTGAAVGDEGSHLLHVERPIQLIGEKGKN